MVRFKFKSNFSFKKPELGEYELTEEEKLLHANSNVYKQLCEQADAMSKTKEYGKEALDGWKVKDNYYDPKSNFKGVLYEKDGKYALAYAGTERPSLKSLGGWKDWGANLKMGITGDNAQNKKAREFAKKMIGDYGLTPENTVSLGHSEGAFEATNVGLDNGFKTYTFNGFGVHKRRLPEGVDTSNVINYRDAHDPVSKLHANVGKTYITPSTQNQFMSTTPFGSIQSHSIKNMGNCMQSLPVEEYKKRNKLFLDKISDAEITREDIAQMDSKLFALLEPEIDERLKNRQILPSSYIPRSLYRGNGGNARGYYRRITSV